MKRLPFVIPPVCALILAGAASCKIQLDALKRNAFEDKDVPIFQQMDANRDARLSRAEFSAGFADAILTVYNQPRTGNVTADQWNGIERARAGASTFGILDANRDGKLTRNELAPGKERDAVVTRIFDRIDKDHDGFISREEGRPSGLDRTPQQRAEGAGL